MMLPLLIEVAWKSAICAGLTLGVLRLLRTRSAAEQSLVASLGLFALLMLPLASIALPRLELAAPASVVAAASRIVPAETATPEPAQLAVSPPAALAWGDLALAFYLIPVAALLLLLLVGLLRLQQVRARAEVVTDPRWLTALAAAQRRFGLKHGTALLASDELCSTISWGVIRPIIIIDRLRSVDGADAIIAHELAHVHRLDWLRLLVGRLATALFWFNPLVWVLARRAHQLCEEAADDAVLRGEVNRSDYADLLVKAVRHASGPLALAANGVASSQSSIAQRVQHVLDRTRSRRPARFAWLAIALPAAVALNAGLVVAEPVLPSSLDHGAIAQAGERAAAGLARLDSASSRTLAAAIERKDWNARRPAGNTNFYEPAAVEPLLLALRDDSPAVRRIALWGLSEVRPQPGSVASAPVADLLNDPAPEVRAQAARALGDFGAVEQARRIAVLLDDSNPDVRREAAHALGDLQDPATRPALEKTLRDPDPAVRKKAGWALGQVGEAERILKRRG